MYRTIMQTFAPRALLAFLLGAGTAAAQDVRIIDPECGRPRVCVAAPCEQPAPCRVGGVERTARDVRVTLEGRVLRYEVTEQWNNRGRAIGEADYVLPLPRGAAFEDLALEIDGEMVTGEALGAGEARRIYEEIVRKQRDPALVEWMGMGVLRTRIFPIQPGETRTVKVRFRAVAEREGDALRIDVPAPRGQGTASGTTLHFRWPAGEGFGAAWSPTHRMESARELERRVARVDDASGTITLLLPVRDSDRAAISVLTHAPQGEDGYALITLAPPAIVRRSAARDITFVIDVSGSMSGTKLAQAKAAGKQLLNTLGREDRFRLIAFSNDVDEYRDGWTVATANERARAESWLEDLRATGGTNIMGALEEALDREESAGRLALVLFMTDGAPTVGERRGERIAARAGELRGARRVFTFGLGADLNAALLEQVALDGAGTAHFVRPEEDVERVVGVVAQRLTRPVATNLRVRASGVQLRALQPAGRLDLFAGQELTVLARYRQSAIPVAYGRDGAARITIIGDTPDGPVTWEARANFPARRTADAFVGRLWATQRVGWLSAERRRNGASSELDGEMRQLGERWGIPTELTSYLVLEPGMQAQRVVGANAPASVSPSVVPSVRPMRRDDAARGVAGGVASGVTSSPAPSADARASTRNEFELAKAAAEMRDARSIAMSGEVDASGRRRTTSRTFALTDGVWMDDRPKAADGRTFTIKPFSPAYFAAMERIAELRELFVLGERVEVHGRAVTIRLAADGLEQLDERQLTAITRDW
ncbi:MAG: VWA domain-containing protein [Gemmatimonadetes bacterium]|nr:VWA domain-containing protein [Gemmatimonadota bacterium]